MQKVDKFFNTLLNVTLGSCILAIIVVMALLLSGVTAIPSPTDQELKDHSIKEQIFDLNARYVFVYPHPQDLPDGVNLCVDVIIPGADRDTVWLMPDHESAGY